MKIVIGGLRSGDPDVLTGVLDAALDRLSAESTPATVGGTAEALTDLARVKRLRNTSRWQITSDEWPENSIRFENVRPWWRFWR